MYLANILRSGSVLGIGILAGLLVSGCQDKAPRPPAGTAPQAMDLQHARGVDVPAESHTMVAPATTVAATAGQVTTGRVEREVQCGEDQQALVFKGGTLAGRICVVDAATRGLTVIDLSDDWVPFLFSQDPALGDAGKQPYRDTFLALASGRLGTGPKWERARDDRFFELYGIPPILSLVRARIQDEERYACHERIDNQPIVELSGILRQENYAQGRKRLKQLANLESMLEGERKRRNLASIADVAQVDRYHARQVARYQRLKNTVAAINAAQEHLVCEGLLPAKRRRPGIYDWRTADGVGAFQRKHMFLSDDALGERTSEAFVTSPRDLDMRALWRVLRERVVDATGLIEDCSARQEWGTVLGQHLDSSSFREPTGQPLPESGAPDLVSQFTEAAARELGWVDVDSARAFFKGKLPGDINREPLSLRVAVKLPPLPAYHSPQMELRAVVDRGDVWYEFPGWYYSGCVSKPVERHPTVTLYATHQGREIALVRWHTTIGGWNKERLPSGRIALRYKASDVGLRYWRDLVASPAWFPPQSTPDDELVERTGRGVRPKYDTFGPSYRSAYGLVMLIHHQLVKRRSGEVFEDNGIRTHGSANFNSIIKGCSHGCHRLFNHLAVRLGSFLLRHRSFVRHGPLESYYSRRLVARGRAMNVNLQSRGYYYELTPPVPVEVTEGRIRGKQRTPIRVARSLPRK
jgi:hypothetical protein